jgi:hypothetical protein
MDVPAPPPPPTTIIIDESQAPHQARADIQDLVDDAIASRLHDDGKI